MTNVGMEKPATDSAMTARSTQRLWFHAAIVPSGTAIRTVRTIEQTAIAILQCFSADQPAMSVIEIQKRVGLSRPTLYRLLHTLSTRGLIHAEGDPQRFKLAHGVMKLSHVWLSGLDVVNVARPILEELRDATGETPSLFRLEEDRSTCILECESRHVLTISRGVGSSLKIPQGATGKALLAFMSQERQAEFLAEMPKHAQRSNLEEAIRSAAHNGYTISRGEILSGRSRWQPPTLIIEGTSSAR